MHICMRGSKSFQNPDRYIWSCSVTLFYDTDLQYLVSDEHDGAREDCDREQRGGEGEGQGQGGGGGGGVEGRAAAVAAGQGTLC